MRIIDLSRTLQPGMPETSALPRFASWWYSLQEWGDAVNMQAMLITEHTGTNVDAPRHVIRGGATVDQLAIESFVGPAQVLDLRGLEPMTPIGPEHLQRAEARLPSPIQAGDIALLMTKYDEQHWRVVPSAYAELKRRPALTEAGADHLMLKGIKAVGIDTVSPDVSGTTLPVHRALLGKGVLIIEGLKDLDLIPPGRCLFLALPLKICGGTGSPVRAVAIVGDPEAWADT
jgi:kynurenine formamidase